MAIIIKNVEQIKHMRAVGEIVLKTHELLERSIRPGMTTLDINNLAEEYLVSKGAYPSSKGYKGFPAAICVSVNNEVIHGIPGMKKLKEGDIVSIDICANKNGYHADAARTLGVGNISDQDKMLIEVTRKSFFKGIEFARDKMHLHQISAAIQEYVESNGFSVVREFIGHGVGKHMHEDPQIPNYRMPNRGPRLASGMTLAIEPMVNAGDCEVDILDDGWTVVTLDGKNSAHYENTVLITDGEPDILTL